MTIFLPSLAVERLDPPVHLLRNNACTHCCTGIQSLARVLLFFWRVQSGECLYVMIAIPRFPLKYDGRVFSYRYLQSVYSSQLIFFFFFRHGPSKTSVITGVQNKFCTLCLSPLPPVCWECCT